MTRWEKLEKPKYEYLHEKRDSCGRAGKISKELYAWLERVEPHALEGKVLDAGCGGGALAEFFSKDNYVGIDFAEKAIGKAAQDHQGYDFRHLGLTEAPENEQFHTTFCGEVLEHVPMHKLDDVLNRLASLDASYYVFSIGLKPSKDRDHNGQDVHLTVKPPEWWAEVLAMYFTVGIQKLRCNSGGKVTSLFVVCHP